MYRLDLAYFRFRYGAEGESCKRRSKPIVMVDLAVPRDIEAEVEKLDNVYLYTVDDLGRYVQMGQDSRQQAVGQAEAIINARVVNFMQWLESRRLVVPMIQDLNTSVRITSSGVSQSPSFISAR